MNAFIEDGYTAEAHIEGVEGLHPAVRLKYRPTLYDENESMDGAMMRKPAAEYCRVFAACIVSKLVEWDLPAPINLERVSRLQPALFEKIRLTVMGRRASDKPSSGGSPVEEKDFATRLLEGSVCGPEADTFRKQEADTKN